MGAPGTADAAWGGFCVAGPPGATMCVGGCSGREPVAGGVGDLGISGAVARGADGGAGFVGRSGGRCGIPKLGRCGSTANGWRGPVAIGAPGAAVSDDDADGTGRGAGGGSGRAGIGVFLATAGVAVLGEMLGAEGEASGG